MIKFRKLYAEEIDVRVGGITQGKGGFLLLYKDARCDMNILDETLGLTGWQRSHELIDGQLFCNILIWDDEKEQWIKKQDVGIESNSDAEKGRASDSFKRACVNVGIGRELYTSPFIWINDTKASKDNWKYKKFRVKEIDYDDSGKINYLIIDEYINYNWNQVFRFDERNSNKKFAAKNNQVKKVREATQKEIDDIVGMANALGLEQEELIELMEKAINKNTFSKGFNFEEYTKMITALTDYSANI